MYDQQLADALKEIELLKTNATRRHTYSPEQSADIAIKVAARTASLTAEIERLKVQRDAALEKVNLLEGANGKLSRQVIEFSEEVNCRGERITVTIAALRETREALASITPPEGGDWWCPHCQEALAGSRVTFQERCDTCGSLVSLADGKEFDIARAVLARHADLAGEVEKEGENNGRK